MAGDTNGSQDVFLRDRLAGATERVSVATGGGQANGDSFTPAISADGRYVAFHSLASNLVAGDTNDTSDVFVRDRGDPDDDGDGVPNDVDNCPDAPNPGQADQDGDGLGDACDPDDDNEAVTDGADDCPGTPVGTRAVAGDG